MAERSRVPLPREAERPFSVWVNGVSQEEGRDYAVEGHALVFERRLQKEGKLGVGRWTAMFLGLFGTYRQNDSVDVKYSFRGQERLATGLDITRLEEPASGREYPS
jgi:hypothetical protein